MSQWVSVKDKMPPKDRKFIFYYYFGMGLGQWGQSYILINNNSERTKEKYLLILHPSEIVQGDIPMQFDEEKMNEMDIYWMEMPEKPKEKE